MRESWSTTDWGEACGPKPAASGGAGGGTVTVTEQGSELSFSGGGRSFSTSQCWDPLPGLRPTSHSGGKRGWSTSCSSPAGDSRRASVNTLVSATDDTIVISETGLYEFSIKGSTCKASVSRSRSMKLIQRAGEAAASASVSAAPSASAPVSAAPAPAPDPVPRATELEPARGSQVGVAAPSDRLEVTPTRKLMRPGESFTIAVRVLNKSGAVVSTAKPTVEVDPSSAIASSLHVSDSTVSADADAGEGTASILVTLSGKTLSVSVEVTPPEKYDALLAQRGLDARGEDQTVAVVEIELGLGSVPRDAEDTAKARRTVFLVIVGGITALLGLVALAYFRRGRRAPVDRLSELAPPPNVTFFESAAPSAMECPRCARVLAASTAFCPTDGTALVPSKQAPPPPPVASVPPPPGVASGAASPKPKKTGPAKICPTCGETFASDAGFCGADGTQLVPIN